MQMSITLSTDHTVFKNILMIVILQLDFEEHIDIGNTDITWADRSYHLYLQRVKVKFTKVK